MSRHKQHAGRGKGVKDGPEALRLQIEQLIERGNAKDAFKEAKLLLRQQDTPAHRQLLDRTYLARIQSLMAGGMTESAREVAGNWLEFGVTNSQVLPELILLLPSLGLSDKALSLQDKVSAPEAREKLAGQLADRAVLHPQDASSGAAEVREQAGKVREALNALESDNEAQAMELLQDIPRSSLLADWRLFVRGLAALRRGDSSQARANWDRLDPHRAANKIAQTLLSLDPAEPAKASPSRLAKLESCAFSAPLTQHLEQLKAALQAGDWQRIRLLIGWMQVALRLVDPFWSRRLTAILLEPLAKAAAQRDYPQQKQMLRDFTAILEPLPWDPHWHRFRALAWRGEDVGESITSWRKYLQDLEKGCPAPGGDSRRVQALVWREIGQTLDNLELDWDSHPELFDLSAELKEEDEELDDEIAIQAFEKSLSFDPTQRQVYDSLLRLYEDADMPERVATTLTRLLEAFPNDVDVLKRLIDHHMLRDEPESAMRYLERARALQPLDPLLARMESAVRVALGRHLALEQRFQEAREQLMRAGEVDLDLRLRHVLLARQAALELKAGEDAKAEALIEQAQVQGSEPTELALLLAIESIRFKLPKPLQKRFQQEFKAAAARKVTSAGAGGLASNMLVCLLGKIDYPGRAGHVQEVVRYLGRTTRTKYAEDDLVFACRFLDEVNKNELLDKLACRGFKLFPNSPFFLHFAADLELDKGPWECDLEYARNLLAKALPFAQASQKPADQRLIPAIRETLSKLENIREAMASIPIPPGGMPRTPMEMQRMLANMLSSFADEDDDLYMDESDLDDD